MIRTAVVHLADLTDWPRRHAILARFSELEERTGIECHVFFREAAAR